MNHRAILRITAVTKSESRINYSRRMYAIVRRYTPEAVEGLRNECFAELTGLRTFFKMTYQGIVEKIINDLHTELGITCRVTIATLQEFEEAQMRCKKPKNISTYKEINKLFIGKTFIDASKRSNSRLIKRVRLTVPFIGKVK
jgi:nucleotidyltransferase/DNA polymerase involved in DNA repair